MRTIDKIKQVLPLEEHFSPTTVANMVYPDMIRIDTGGRKFNRCAAVTARILRQMGE